MRHVPQSQNVILGFRDGSVCLFDFVRRRTLFASEPAHSETIFDCRFKPGNPHILATASYDGACKLWDVESMRCVGEMAGQEGVLYGLAWAPGDNDNRLVTVSSKGMTQWGSCTVGA
jgi:WD40 repeat protein